MSFGPYTTSQGVRQAIQFTAVGAEKWTAGFLMPAGKSRIEPGRYEVGKTYPDDGVSASAHLSRWYAFISIVGKGCGRTTPDPSVPAGMNKGPILGAPIGWFEVENVQYAGETVQSLQLRFEMHCEVQRTGEPGTNAPFRGLVQYRADDATQLAGPSAPPAGLWKPAAGATPATGNYIYLESQAGDPVGQGQTFTYQPGMPGVDVSLYTMFSGRSLNFSVTAPDFGWNGEIEGMASLEQLRPGYYGELRTAQSIQGDFGVAPKMRVKSVVNGCPGNGFLDLPYRGWFVVDDVSYVDGALKSLDLRFEQRCEGFDAPLRGQIHWIAP